MDGQAMVFSHFPIFPLIAFLWMVFFMGRCFLRPARRRFFPKPGKWRAFPETTAQNLSAKISAERIPDELKRAGQQIADNLDWEIRFLEQQCSGLSDPKERKTIEEDLRRKREEYVTIVERLEL